MNNLPCNKAGDEDGKGNLAAGGLFERFRQTLVLDRDIKKLVELIHGILL